MLSLDISGSLSFHLLDSHVTYSWNMNAVKAFLIMAGHA